VPVCQNLPADPIDDAIVKAFFQALSPIELDVYAQAAAAQTQADERLAHAQRQQLERLRYEAALAQRQYQAVDPQNRLVAAELEQRWEIALQSVQIAEQEELSGQRQIPNALPLPTDLREAFCAIGKQLPQVWSKLSQQHKKAFLRCLIDKVILQRPEPDHIQARIVWRGGATSLLVIPVAVGTFSQLSNAQAMEKRSIDLFHEGKTDEQIAQTLTTLGFRSPMRPDTVLVSTVRAIRLKHGLLQVRHQSHPRHVPGYLTPTELAKALDIPPHWVYDRIHNGSIQIAKQPSSSALYLFPDEPRTLQLVKRLKQGNLKKIRISERYQDV
jgi:hypothetical protein